MISKNKLQSFISKYYIGQFNQAKWRIKNNEVKVYVGSHGLAANVNMKNFPLEDGDIAVFDSNKLQKLVAVTSGDLLLSLEKQGQLNTKLKISDANFELDYSLADPLIIPKIDWYKDLDWEMELDVSREDIDSLIKAKNALSEYDTLLIRAVKNLDGETVCEFVFGDNTNFSSKVTYQIEGNVNDVFVNAHVPFDSNVLKEILNVNKDSDNTKFYLSSKGLAKWTFSDEDTSSIYYMTRNEQINN